MSVTGRAGLLSPVGLQLGLQPQAACSGSVAASRREETRGCHWREDFPTGSPLWRGHLLAGLDAGGRLTETWEALR